MKNTVTTFYHQHQLVSIMASCAIIDIIFDTIDLALGHDTFS